MGKKKRKSGKVSASGKPFVSVCTPTYNRRVFIPALIENFQKQTYPMELLEWIVVDDGIDSVKDLFEGIPNVKYFTKKFRINKYAKQIKFKEMISAMFN